MSLLRGVRNKDGIFINTECFREEGKHFEKHGYYTPDPWGSIGWHDYWQEELNRTKYGYSSGGVTITGDHYHYLNYCPIQKVDISKISKRKKVGFPDFWDGDYNYYWATEIAEKGIFDSALLSSIPTEEMESILKLDTLAQAEAAIPYFEGLGLEVKIAKGYLLGGYHIIVGKSRRKGYSYKNGAKMANRFNNTKNSLSIVGAFDKKYLYPKGTMGMATSYINFINEHTGWSKSREKVDRQDHVKASFLETENGIPIEKGYKSEIMAITFKDNPSAARGKDAQLFLFEEAGAFPNLKASYTATEPATRAGIYVTGQIIIFGTGGDMESGSVDFADMFYDPVPYNLMAFENIWDTDAANTNCGFFHPLYWNQEGHYDQQGNSNRTSSIENELKQREKIRKKSSNASQVLQGRVQEYCLNPAEAFLTVSTNDFPVIELRNQLNKVMREQLHTKNGQPVSLYKEEGGKVMAKPDLTGELKPIYHYKPKITELTGCPVIFEYPIENAPKGLYKMGYDPYVQDQTTGLSLGSVFVYMADARFSYSRHKIVAEYTGRPSTTDDFNRIVMLLAELYSAEVMHENMVKEVKSYFDKKRKLHLLAAQPDRVISKSIQNSKVSRIYGCHMNEQLKDAGAKYIKRWLLTERDADENGDIILNLETIDSPGLLEELIRYNKKGNFDRVMAFMMIMFQLEEDEENLVYNPESTNSNAKDLLAMMGKMHTKYGQKTLI